MKEGELPPFASFFVFLISLREILGSEKSGKMG